MSAVAPARPAVQPRPAPRPAAPLRLAAGRVGAEAATSRGRLPFALLITAILVTGLVALLMLHTLAAQDAFRVHALNEQLSNLQDQEQQLRVANDRLSSPDRLLARARALGMRPMRLSSYQRLRDGRTIATATVVPPPAPVVTASAKASATPTKTVKHQHHHRATSGR